VRDFIMAPPANMAKASFTLVGNSTDSRGLAQCRATVCCTPPNDCVHLPGRLQGT
jgi:hypothetical protein